jgi:16S rRNA (guanine966-N2)-methyltransferase
MIPAVAKMKRDLPQPHRNSVRIVGGAWRGRRLAFPDAPDLRPTPDRVRETLFNWLQHELAGRRCLDLFAGSGALGLEALSRGAAQAVFVDASVQVAQNLRMQIAHLKAGNSAVVLNVQAEDYLQHPGEAFDIVFLDPPFKSKPVDEHVSALASGGWLKPEAFIYMESPRTSGPPQLPEGITLIKSKSAGDVGYHLARVNRRTDHA